MKRLIFLLRIRLRFGFAVGAYGASSDHVEVGVFADYMNFSATDPHINFVGVGGRAAFNVHPNVQLEAEMSYDFKRNFTSVFSNGVTTQFVNTDLRPLTGCLDPNSRPARDRFVPMSLANSVSLISASRSERARRVRGSPGRHSDRGHPFCHVSGWRS